ncbi:exopolyphosphatase [Varunaivibrio sulfuroxidans]|uniref:NanoRNase/pAp phosphatase (C-di-AMP/oligoRNAs hydrolase) n=1 Tax=Varunaivibrio sulfuroxidans TaxID=1773489 RepID=A0A4R3J8I3_9PROT|nr:exopolyphosphatase [Varunaivibrio sulfuroxidans]TCS61675.1 nanoRNase/pAp phosphatase (c-di-AMP/oligoRNAs hydrolase) [Varunaivibrio sulfuroxidans]WES32140.1 exopolyphosphatase [Varunaivibrio sulfuroxidans]
MSDKKYRLVTRADFDGVVAGALLQEIGIIDEVIFAEPKDMQDGKIAITANDITTNLPYVPGVHLCFDHHLSETQRIAERPSSHIIDPNAPSAARVVYNYYDKDGALDAISKDLMDAVDKADSAQYSEEEILAPGPWTLLNFLLDPRTGLQRFDTFSISHEQFMKDMMLYCRHHPVEEILAIPDVRERAQLYMAHEEKFELQLRRSAKIHKNLVVVDLRDEPIVFAGNRFTLYAIFPACNISIQITRKDDGTQTIFAVGKSIVNRTSKTSVGSLMLHYGGGGHASAGTCRIDNERAETVLKELIARINADG